MQRVAAEDRGAICRALAPSLPGPGVEWWGTATATNAAHKMTADAESHLSIGFKGLPQRRAVSDDRGSA
ncbi:hypothetical protein CABS01_15285 [Colletotrichum abscissum]|uniref:Uncharacterized protein n=4 Tax=Colletotrichum acutatum species complex TaxID=2707335 RepID=A0A9P9XEC1_9PEZI|nr:uncharacterized protein CLUP02_14360 [Colletotrichum lupini]XP_060306586.1 uncharacterized protein CCOS01_14612 [Colletotrichum costaricense]XP_060382813.1 uncharacterized protein CTAM01_06527 [Colletotrichum tamarilloi]XP_060391888.1 uncharacterized protein CABS01_15285 [Colletotrichum abscissum]KAI3550763.1 hypothetical protein CABS02_07562 [Colletotrichum abscissum]KAK1476521.1 hypothetical protein CABS01_15285 [Colletotrichum abscissum]KAK1500592.1 hypothetical protein CTAM01_06527 [Co